MSNRRRAFRIGRLFAIGGVMAAGIAVATWTAAATGVGRSRATTSRAPAFGHATTPAIVAGEPLEVASASLAQDGLDLVWRVQLAEPFAPGALANDHRTLCLLIERAPNGTVAGQACVAGAGPHGAPSLIYEPVSVEGPGAARTIAAAITRSSSSELTAAFLPSEVGIGYRAMRWQVISTVRARVCVSSHRGRSGCYILFPVRPALLALHAPQLIGCVPSGPSEVFQGPARQREIALTFDDGPGTEPAATEFVDLLAREGVPATFFEIGRQIAENDPDGAVERQMLADGDMIGDHTWSHPNMTSLSSTKQRAELELTAEAIRRRTGFAPCLWRAPYGSVDPQLISLARSMGMLTVMWDVDPRDWALPGVGAIYQRVISAAHDGAIVIQHFGGGPRYQTLAALPREIATLRAEGYTFVTVPQLLGLRLIYR
jgi:peptidoglycan-N-acetylglucosamine deacetylase